MNHVPSLLVCLLLLGFILVGQEPMEFEVAATTCFLFSDGLLRHRVLLELLLEVLDEIQLPQCIILIIIV